MAMKNILNLKAMKNIFITMSITGKLTKNLFFIYVTNIKDQFYIVRVCEGLFAALLVFMFNIYIFII